MKVDFLSSHPKHGRKHGNDIIQLLQEAESGNSDSKGTKLLIRPNNSMLNTVYIKKKIPAIASSVIAVGQVHPFKKNYEKKMVSHSF